MKKQKLYDSFDINDKGYALNRYEEKDEVYKCLEKSTPIDVDKVSVEGCSCSFEWQCYNFYINGVDIEVNNFLDETLIAFCTFLEKLFSISKPLVCCIEYECIVSLAVAIPINDKKIRFTYYYEWSRGTWKNEPERQLDIIVDKELLIQRFKECFDIFYERAISSVERYISKYELRIIEEYREKLTTYLNNIKKQSEADLKCYEVK